MRIKEGVIEMHIRKKGRTVAVFLLTTVLSVMGYVTAGQAEEVRAEEDKDGNGQEQIRSLLAEQGTGSRSVEAAGEVFLEERILYEGLIPGEVYCIRSHLVEEESRQTLDREMSGRVRFVPEAESGSLSLVYKVDTRGLEGQDLVTEDCLYRMGLTDEKMALAEEDGPEEVKALAEEDGPEEVKALAEEDGPEEVKDGMEADGPEADGELIGSPAVYYPVAASPEFGSEENRVHVKESLTGAAIKEEETLISCISRPKTDLQSSAAREVSKMAGETSPVESVETVDEAAAGESGETAGKAVKGESSTKAETTPAITGEISAAEKENHTKTETTPVITGEISAAEKENRTKTETTPVIMAQKRSADEGAAGESNRPAEEKSTAVKESIAAKISAEDKSQEEDTGGLMLTIGAVILLVGAVTGEIIMVLNRKKKEDQKKRQVKRYGKM